MLERTGFEIYLSQAAWTRACGSAIVRSAPLPISAALYCTLVPGLLGAQIQELASCPATISHHARQHAQPVAENKPRHPQLAFPLFSTHSEDGSLSRFRCGTLLYETQSSPCKNNAINIWHGILTPLFSLHNPFPCSALLHV